MHKLLLLSLFILMLAPTAYAAEKSVLAFYNVENMFDHLDDPIINDAEYTPNGDQAWTQKKSEQKIANIAHVINAMGNPDILGLAEVENAYVIEQLIKSPKLLAADYGYVHFDSPDERGIDVALIYKKSTFSVSSARTVSVDLSGNTSRPTRDILHVEGNLKGEKIHLLVNHWPSRSSSEAGTIPLRATAAKTAKMILDEINHEDPVAKIILMGDLNDNPTDRSLVTHLGAKNFKTSLIGNDLYNPYYLKFKKGYGSNAYQDVWSNFDQILVSNNLVQGLEGWKFSQDQIFNKSFLIQSGGRFSGYPLRTTNDTGSMGYSDHLPVYITLEK